MELTVDEKKRALKYFKSLKFGEKISLDTVKDKDRFGLSVDMINQSVFINDFYINVSGDSIDLFYSKEVRTEWRNQLIEYIRTLKKNTKIKLSYFSNFDDARINILELSNIDYFFPDFRIEIRDGDYETDETDYLIKFDIPNGLKIDNRTLEEVTSDLEKEGSLIECIGMNDKLIINQSDYEKLTNKLTDIASNFNIVKNKVREQMVVQTIDGFIHGNYCTTFNEVDSRFDEGQKEVKLIAILDKIISKTSKNGFEFKTYSIEAFDEKKSIAVFSKDKLKIPDKTMCLFIMEREMKKGKYSPEEFINYKFISIQQLKKLR